MSTAVKTLFLSLVVVLVLTACGPKEAPPQVVKTEVIVSEEVPVVAEEKEKVEEMAVNEVASESRYGSNMSCDQLGAQESRRECEMQVNEMIGNMLSQEILSTFDVKRCSELPDEVAEECRGYLGKAGVQGPISGEEIILFEEIVNGTFEEPNENGDSSPYPVYDSSRCAELKTSGYRAYCEKEINERQQRNLFNQIIQMGKGSRCDELSSEELRSECEANFGAEIDSGAGEASAAGSVVVTEGDGA